MIRNGLLVLFTIVAMPVWAQDLVGKALVKGREVELFSDNTWRFSDKEVTDCRTLSTKVAFCGSASEWQNAAKPSPDILAAFRHDATSYGQYIVEDLGTAQGLTLPAVRQFVLDFAGQISGEPPVVISTEPVSLGGLTGETIVYGFSISGLQTVYSNSILLGENTLLQVMTYQLSDVFTPEHEALHAAFLAATRLTE